MTSSSGILDALANGRVAAVLRISAGVLALGKGALLAADGQSLALVAAWVVCASMVTVGWRARLGAGLLVALGAGLLVTGDYKNHLYLLTILMGLVALLETQRHYSFQRRGDGPVPAWPLVLMQFQVSVVYGFAAIAKLNPEFLSGDVLAGYFDGALLPAPIPDAVVPGLALLAIAVEGYIAAAVWLPRLRASAFGLVIPLHAGMLFVATDWVQLGGIVIFAGVMATLLSSFAAPAEGSRLVIWDDSCSFCRRWIAFFRRADAFGALRFVGASDMGAYASNGVSPEAALEAMHVRSQDGEVVRGFAAVRAIVEVLPFGFLVAPYLGLPGVRTVGERAYRRVAARRTCAYMAGSVRPAH